MTNFLNIIMQKEFIILFSFLFPKTWNNINSDIKNQNQYQFSQKKIMKNVLIITIKIKKH